jgi:hypothetical protein
MDFRSKIDGAQNAIADPLPEWRTWLARRRLWLSAKLALRGRSASVAAIGNEHANHAILAGGEEQLAILAVADMQIGSRQALAHGLLD